MSRRASPRLRTLLLVAVAGLAVVVLAAFVLVSGGDDPAPQPEPTAGATPSSSLSPSPSQPPLVPLSEVDTRTAVVTRDTFCAGVSPDAVTSALGEPAATATATEYGDGDSVQVTGRVRDISHEFGCAWTTDTVGARAWVFAPPVTRRTAASLLRAAQQGEGCRPVAGAPEFGNPSIALTCRTSRGVQTSYRGLFGDAWLTCTVADRGAKSAAGATEVAERAERWCAAVLTATAP